jgi:hypothetical protein
MRGWDVREHRGIDNTQAGSTFNTEVYREHSRLARLQPSRKVSNTRIDNTITSATTRHARCANKMIDTEIICVESRFEM